MERPWAIVLDPADQALSLARTLARREVPVAVLCARANAWAGRTRSATDARVLPPVAAGTEAWVNSLADLAERGPGVLISCSDAATELLVAERERIPATLAAWEGPGTPHLELMSKEGLHGIAERAGVSLPWTGAIHDHDEIARVLADPPLPCVLKPIDSSRAAAVLGQRKALVAEDVAAARRDAAWLLVHGIPLVAMEYVPGPETNIEVAVVVRGADGRYPLAYGVRKLRQYPLDFGVGATCASAEIPATMALTRTLLDAAGFVGLAAVEAKIDERTGLPVLIEANVRVPQHLAVGDVAGAEASWRIYATLAGLRLGPQPAPRPGRVVVHPLLEAKAVAGRRQRGELPWRSLLRSYRGLAEVGPLDLRDPAPALGLVERAVGNRLARRG